MKPNRVKYLKKWRKSIMITLTNVIRKWVMVLSLMVIGTCFAASAEAVEIKHAMGTTMLDQTPARVVVLDNGALDNMLALGVKPAGATPIFLDKPFVGYLAEQAGGIDKVGTINQPNLESIAALNPDLIVGTKDLHEAIYDKLSQIAPTVFTETLFDDWKGRLKLHGLSVGKGAEADALIAAYEEKLAAFKSLKVTKSVSVLRGRTDNVTIYLGNSWSGEFVREVGLKRPASQQDNEKWGVKITQEQIADIDADAILWFSRADENYLTKDMKTSRLWNTLEAVKQEQVYRLDAGVWLSGMGIQARNLMLDDVKRIFTK